MNWINKEWSKEDEEFALKRKVNNKQSKYHPHIIGSFFSYKMKRTVQYESLWGECLFYYLLELDPLTIRYYEQPVEIPVITLERKHVPDVLVFREGSSPILFQVKGSEELVASEEFEEKNKACLAYAGERGWLYHVVYPKFIPDVVISNTIFLWNYIKNRKWFGEWISEIIQKVHFYKEITIEDLARSFSTKIDFRFILPLIYHLIATGNLSVDLSKKLSERSNLYVGSINKQIFQYFEREDGPYEIL